MARCSWIYSLLAFFCFVSNGVKFCVQGHGRLVNPPSRSTAWRYGFPTEKDYNDAEAYCGGWTRQHTQNGGKCGVCGDAFDLPQPRAHENSGRYGQGVIVATYKMNSDIEVGVELTANHQGYFEFRLCPWNRAKGPETDECFEQHLLRRTDAATGDPEGHKYHPGPGSNVIFRSTYKLPDGLTCTQCVLQWRYIAGNNWGTCPNGTGKVGCGPQEQFRGCADVSITLDGVPDVTTVVVTSTTSKPNRTRGTVTSRVSRPTSTSTVPSTTTIVRSSTTATTTTSESNEIIPPDANYGGSNPGPYAGIVIALATLLFAILCICGITFYFYYCHQAVKKFAGDQWKRMRRRIASTGSSSNMDKKPPLKLPATVFSHHQPQLLQVVPCDNTSSKPPVPPRINRQVNEQQIINVRQLSLVISEPIDVAINGVPVPRDDHEPNVSTA